MSNVQCPIVSFVRILHDRFDDVDPDETVFIFDVLAGGDDKTTYHCSEAKQNERNSIHLMSTNDDIC